MADRIINTAVSRDYVRVQSRACLKNRPLYRTCELKLQTANYKNSDYPFAIISVKKIKWSRYRPGVIQRVGRGIAQLFYDHGTRMGWMVISTPRSHFTPGKDSVLILQEAGWSAGLVWTGGKSRPHWDSIPDRPARSQSVYRLSYRAHRDYLSTDCKGKGKVHPRTAHEEGVEI